MKALHENESNSSETNKYYQMRGVCDVTAWIFLQFKWLHKFVPFFGILSMGTNASKEDDALTSFVSEHIFSSTPNKQCFTISKSRYMMLRIAVIYEQSIVFCWPVKQS